MTRFNPLFTSVPPGDDTACLRADDVKVQGTGKISFYYIHNIENEEKLKHNNHCQKRDVYSGIGHKIVRP